MPSVKLYQQVDPVDRGLRHLDEPVRDRLRELGSTIMPVQSLRRTGRRPFLFNGNVIATVCGITPLLPFWYELNVHRTVLDSYVSDIRLFNKAPDLPDLFWVDEHDDLDDVSTHFERYDPAGDLSPPQEMTGHGGSSAQLALWTARLQLQVDQITQHYRALVGDLLGAIQPPPA